MVYFGRWNSQAAPCHNLFPKSIMDSAKDMGSEDQTTRILILGDSRCKQLCSDICKGLSERGPDIPIWLEIVHKGGLDILDLLKLLEEDYIPSHGKYDFI